LFLGLSLRFYRSASTKVERQPDSHEFRKC